MSLFKLPSRHKRFEYIPRYFDPRKEELNKKIAQAEKSANGDQNYKREISFRQQTSDKWGNAEYKKKTMQSNLRLVIIFGLVLLACYILFVGLDDIVPFLENN
jgi:DNA-directed RNA polymerase sigma subunit (sigma70/sigma32)